jgi:hypothetical protein
LTKELELVFVFLIVFFVSLLDLGKLMAKVVVVDLLQCLPGVAVEVVVP